MIEMIKNKFMIGIGAFLIGITYVNGILARENTEKIDKDTIIIAYSQQR